MQVLWLRFLTEIDENTKKVAKALLDDPHVNEALEIVEESAYSEAEMLAYDKFWDRVSREATREANLKEAEEKLGAMTAERDAAKARTRRGKGASRRGKGASRRGDGRARRGKCARRRGRGKVAARQTRHRQADESRRLADGNHREVHRPRRRRNQGTVKHERHPSQNRMEPQREEFL